MLPSVPHVGCKKKKKKAFDATGDRASTVLWSVD
jgi:hypothetical protein